MKITKYGHCCLLIEVGGRRILTDPGAFSSGHEELADIDIILVTHEHADHCHTDSIIHILDTNPQARIVTNSSVSALLEELGITTTILEGEGEAEIAEVALQAFDGKHAEIYGKYGLVQNTGYLIAHRLFYPGDAYTIPNTPVEILALPVAGPWCKVSEALEYGYAVAPAVAIPVHDAVLSELGKNVVYSFFTRLLKEPGIEFITLEHGVSKEFTPLS
jgi:L-ascorbate metabolism protein UlaG (beta-lactamase superfamily)